MFKELVKPIKLWINSSRSPFPIKNDKIILDRYGEQLLNSLKTIEYEYSLPKIDDIVEIYKMYGEESEMVNYKNNYSKMLSEIKLRLDNVFLIKYPNTDKRLLNSLFAIYSYENFYE